MEAEPELEIIWNYAERTIKMQHNEKQKSRTSIWTLDLFSEVEHRGAPSLLHANSGPLTRQTLSSVDEGRLLNFKSPSYKTHLLINSLRPSTSTESWHLDLGQNNKVWFTPLSPEPQSAETSPVLTQSSPRWLGLPHSRGGQRFLDEQRLERVSSNDCPLDPQEHQENNNNRVQRSLDCCLLSTATGAISDSCPLRTHTHVVYLSVSSPHFPLYLSLS